VGGGLSFGGTVVSRPYWRQSGEFPMSVREDSSSVAGDLVGIPTRSLVKLIPWWRRAIVLGISYAASTEGKRKTAMIEPGCGAEEGVGVSTLFPHTTKARECGPLKG